MAAVGEVEVSLVAMEELGVDINIDVVLLTSSEK